MQYIYIIKETNMSKNWKLIHIKSKQRGEDELSPKLPTCEQLEYGEIAINYGKDIETIAIRNENDEIIKFIPEHKIKEYVDQRIAEVMTLMEKQSNEIELDDDNSIDSGEY